MDLAGEIGQKGFDADRIARYVLDNPICIGRLLEGVRAPKGSARFGYAKVVRLISEQRPDLIYSFFDVFAELNRCDNNILKWGAILVLSNLAVVDRDNKFDAIFKEYFAPIAGPVMITAANIIGGSPKIAAAKPNLTQRIVREILKVEKARYQSHGKPSPECRNVAIGHAIEAFDQIFDQIDDQQTVLKFVKRQLRNSRKPVIRRAEQFLRKHPPANARP
ncbi:MAG: hypothetical protein GX455_05275 [Phycisphaerae bacterium]|nr:hypothetical protein [Phycisphaerae bacterium]